VGKLTFLAVPLLLLITTAVSLAQTTPAVQLGLQQSPQLGAYLTDPNGMTLYTFAGDSPGVSNVSGQLEQVWPPLRPLADRGLALPDGVGGDLSAITRADGSPQMAYNGMPLYTFVNDTGPGVVNGQGGDNGQFTVAAAQLTGAVSATETPVVAGATPEEVPQATETPAAEATETPVAVATETPVAVATETPVVAGATPPAVATAVVATAIPAVLAATPSALPSAGGESDPSSTAALLGVLALGLLTVATLMRRGSATR
jgi:predicted lipoprotein with Yx(FWY)xxD motif